ncbi:MAG: NDP-sugar synthase [Deltaproteobacteria bacterium]|nr:NDP-sugar synthase [Deltaproteobacteria bacterium]
MRAMILAAGLGTRLSPLSLVRPKVLAPVLGITVLEFWIERLRSAGCEAVMVNAHNLHQKLCREIQGKRWPIPVEVSVEPVLLGTGGGIAKVLDYFGNQSFSVVNGDIICQAPLETLLEQHRDSGAPASLLLHDHPDFNNVAVNSSGSILGFGRAALEMARNNRDLELRAFTGIHFIDPVVFRDFPAHEPWEILTAYERLIAEGERLAALFVRDLFWEEMGSVEAYRNLTRKLSYMPEGALPPLPTGKRCLIHPTAEVDDGALLEGVNIVGRRSRVAHDVYLKDCILWDEVRVKPGSRLRNCILTDGAEVKGEHKDAVLMA